MRETTVKRMTTKALLTIVRMSVFAEHQILPALCFWTHSMSPPVAEWGVGCKF